MASSFRHTDRHEVSPSRGLGLVKPRRLRPLCGPEPGALGQTPPSEALGRLIGGSLNRDANGGENTLFSPIHRKSDTDPALSHEMAETGNIKLFNPNG